LTDSIDDNASNVPALDPSIIPTLIDTEMQNSYLDYAMSVIVSRALPDVQRWSKAGAQKDTLCHV
jgi:DNA gyrase subunit A